MPAEGFSSRSTSSVHARDVGRFIVFNYCLILIKMDRGHCQADLKHGSDQGSDKPDLTLGTISRYSVYILICITKWYIFVLYIGVNSLNSYKDVLDMCSDMSIISNASYLTSPAFPARSTGTGSCLCTARAVDQHRFHVVISIKHAILSDEDPCNEKLLIFKNGKQNKQIISSCSPFVARPSRHNLRLKNITVIFHQRHTISSHGKTVVWIGFQSKFCSYQHRWISWY